MHVCTHIDSWVPPQWGYAHRWSGYDLECTWHTLRKQHVAFCIGMMTIKTYCVYGTTGSMKNYCIINSMGDLNWQCWLYGTICWFHEGMFLYGQLWVAMCVCMRNLMQGQHVLYRELYTESWHCVSTKSACLHITPQCEADMLVFQYVMSSLNFPIELIRWSNYCCSINCCYHN